MGWHSRTQRSFTFRLQDTQGEPLGYKGGGFLMLMEKLQQERLMCSIVAVAGAERMLRDTLRFCSDKVDFWKTLAKLHNNRFKIVETATEIRLGRVFS